MQSDRIFTLMRKPHVSRKDARRRFDGKRIPGEHNERRVAKASSLIPSRSTLCASAGRPPYTGSNPRFQYTRNFSSVLSDQTLGISAEFPFSARRPAEAHFASTLPTALKPRLGSSPMPAQLRQILDT